MYIVHCTTRELNFKSRLVTQRNTLSANSSRRTKSIFNSSPTNWSLHITYLHLWHTMNMNVFVYAIRISINRPNPKWNSKNWLNNRNHVKCKMNENIRAWVAHSVIMVDDIVLRFLCVVTSFISSVSISPPAPSLRYPYIQVFSAQSIAHILLLNRKLYRKWPF